MTTSSVLLLSVEEIFALKTPERKKDFLDSALRDENIRTGWCMNRTFSKRKKEKKNGTTYIGKMVEDTGIICSGLWTGTGRRCAATGRTVAGGELSGIFLLLLAVAHLSVGFVDSLLLGSVSGVEDIWKY